MKKGEKKLFGPEKTELYIKEEIKRLWLVFFFFFLLSCKSYQYDDYNNVNTNDLTKNHTVSPRGYWREV